MEAPRRELGNDVVGRIRAWSRCSVDEGYRSVSRPVLSGRRSTEAFGLESHSLASQPLPLAHPAGSAAMGPLKLFIFLYKNRSWG